MVPPLPAGAALGVALVLATVGILLSRAFQDAAAGAALAASGPLARFWGQPGVGQWITVYANKGHTYAVIAGLRWDTSGGKGPRWHEDMRSAKGYRKRHWPGL